MPIELAQRCYVATKVDFTRSSLDMDTFSKRFHLRPVFTADTWYYCRTMAACYFGVSINDVKLSAIDPTFEEETSLRIIAWDPSTNGISNDTWKTIMEEWDTLPIEPVEKGGTLITGQNIDLKRYTAVDAEKPAAGE
jgi:hypothetical protein